MSQASLDFLNLLVRYPGEELYFFMISAVSFACWFMAFGQQIRFPKDAVVRRYSRALSAVVLLWLMYIVGAVLVQVTDWSAIAVLPPLERFITVMTIIALTWALLRPDETSNADRMTNWIILIFAVIAILQYVFTVLQWVEIAGETDFNLSIFGVTWMFLTLAIVGFGIVRLLSQLGNISDSPLKIVFYTVLLVGFSVTLVLILQGNIIGDYAGPARLTFVTAMAILPVVVYRMVINRLQFALVKIEDRAKRRESTPKPTIAQQPVPQTLAAQPQSNTKTQSPIERESVQLLRALGLILEDASTTSLPNKIINSVSDVLKFDVVALLRLQDANYADFSVVYDNVMKRSITGIALNLDNQPTLATAIERRTLGQLTLEGNSDEVNDLYSRLDIDQRGPIYLQPLIYNREVIAICVAANPYSARRLMSAEEDLLKGISVIAGGLLALSDAADEAQMLAEERAIQAMLKGVQGAENEIAAAQQAEENLRLQQAKQQIDELTGQVELLKGELTSARTKILTDLEESQDLSISQRFVALGDEQDRLQDERDALANRLQEAEAALASATTSDRESIFNNMIDAFEQEKADLIAERDRLQAQVLQFGEGAVANPANSRDLIQKMTQEKARLRDERDQLRGKLSDIASQLQSLGIEVDSTGFAQLIRQLSEQRAELQTQNTGLKQELDRMRSERARLEQAILMEEARVMRIQMLETEVKNLAGDREALTKQRDKLRANLVEADEKQEAIKEHRAKLMAQAAGYEMELREAHENLERLNADMEKLANERSDLANFRDVLGAENQALQTERDQLLARADGDRGRVEEVGSSGVGSLTQMIEELTGERSELERELNQTRSRLSSVQNQVEKLQMQLSTGGSNDTKYQPDNPELLLSLIQELRTPLTSIIGYVDLLIGESAGILGEMQRKFLQRVSTNVSRLSSMLDDLVHITELDTGQYVFKAAPVDIVTLIEDAITNSSTQFREKGLTVNLNLDHDIPPINADYDAINQVIGQLLTNAYLVTPPDAEIFASAHMRRAVLEHENENAQPVDCVYVAVEDRGGGIQPEDEARVFARKYKAENPLIQGLGDTGVGMAVAKALVEAHGGRLWLESRTNSGAIFGFVIPLDDKLQIEG